MRSLLLPKPKRTPPAWLSQWVYAHRGLHREGVPENSLAATRDAIAAGYGIECDIQRSLDDQPMVFHDWVFGRLTDGEGDVESQTAAEIQGLHYRENGEQIATLAELLDEIVGKVPLLIEIKSKPSYDIDRSCEMVAREVKDYSGEFAVMSFDPRVARWFRKNAPSITAGLVMREDEHGHTQKPWQRRLALWISRPDFLAYHIHALPNPMVAKLRKSGLPILTWTVNSSELRCRAEQYADAIIAEGEGIG